MNIQTVSQRLRSVQCFEWKILEGMFYSNLEGYVWRSPVCIPLRDTNMAIKRLSKQPER